MFEIENGVTPFTDHSTVDTKVFTCQKAGGKVFLSGVCQYGIKSLVLNGQGNLMLKFASYAGHVGCGSGRIL